MLKLPVGIEDFAEIRQLGFYYIDKTKLIEQLLNGWGKVSLFTRPRRFGKTLNMSMLKTFFEIGTNKELFDGLYIAENEKLCGTYLGKYPVIFLSLKGVDALTFEAAKYRLTELIGNEAGRFSFLQKSEQLSEREKEQYQALIALDAGKYTMDENQLISSLKMLSGLLYKHYGKKVIILIDEYDVPLDKAFQHGYYKEMVSLIRGLFGQVLKTNDALQFAVLTGCLRITKESIFTGLNNFKVFSVADVRFDEMFGFTDTEVRELLEYYGLEEHFDEIKEWYDGYHFGDADIYCPWDVINHVDLLRAKATAKPQAYWINSSGNDLVKRFVDKADKTTKDEIEKLIAGETVRKLIRLELTYDEIDNSIDNLWSVLFTTGYLTQAGDAENGFYNLIIPNREVREVFVFQIQEWFKETIIKQPGPVQVLCKAFIEGNAAEVEQNLTAILGKSISVLDTKAREGQKENFYHGLLFGLLRSEPEWLIRTNQESGDGLSDILVEPENPDAGIIIEVKYSPTFQGLEKVCQKAMEQIENRRYEEFLRNDGRNEILAYGIAFCKKRCKVIMKKM